MPGFPPPHELQKIAAQISPGPMLGAVRAPETWAQPAQCFSNVFTKAQRDGGRPLFGWTFHHRTTDYGGYLYVVHHAVWSAPDRRVVDVTPFHDDPRHHPLTATQGRVVVFWVDDDASPVSSTVTGPDGKPATQLAPRPMQYFPLTDDERLVAHVAHLNAKEIAACEAIYRRR